MIEERNALAKQAEDFDQLSANLRVSPYVGDCVIEVHRGGHSCERGDEHAQESSLSMTQGLHRRRALATQKSRIDVEPFVVVDMQQSSDRPQQ